MPSLFSDEFLRINRQLPWLLPFLPMHEAYAADNLNHNSSHADGTSPLYLWLNHYIHQANVYLTNHAGKPLSFTHQHDLEHGMAYEAHIGQYHKIPTRDNLHDWFGACVWSVFPKSKALLNAKHLAHLSDDQTGNKRNRVRDTITVFDENGAILVVADDETGVEIGQSLQKFDWQTCLVKHRNSWSNYHQDTADDNKAKLFIFGHALLEQLIKPYKSLCSHTLIIHVPPTFFDENLENQLTFLDDCLAHRLDKFLTDTVTPKQFSPLPVLGVPYFYDNSNPAFYDDAFVFRSGRKQQSSS